MISPIDSNLVFRALIMLGLILFGFYIAFDRGVVELVLSSDRSYISYVILGLYAIASGHWLWLSRTLGAERSHFALLQESLQESPQESLQDSLQNSPHDSDEELRSDSDGLVGEFVRNWQAKGAAGDPSTLLEAFGDQLANRHALGHFASDVLLKLGLLGTIVGFILMLLPIGDIKEFDPSVMQTMLAAMSGGMAVALYTTLAGLVTSTLLKLQYHVLDAAAADLATRLAVLSDVYLGHDAA